MTQKIVILSFYTAQRSALREALEKECMQELVCTIDSYQDNEAACVFLSFVQSWVCCLINSIYRLLAPFGQVFGNGASSLGEASLEIFLNSTLISH